jgi:hypothetical protein
MRPATPRRGHAVAGALSGSSLVAVTRGLPEPWPTVLAIAAPAVAVVWAFLQAALFDRLTAWQVKRLAAREARIHRTLIAELTAGLDEAKQAAKSIPDADARSRREQELQQLEDAISASHLEFLWQRLHAGVVVSKNVRTVKPQRRTARSKTRKADEPVTRTAPAGRPVREG